MRNLMDWASPDLNRAPLDLLEMQRRDELPVILLRQWKKHHRGEDPLALIHKRRERARILLGLMIGLFIFMCISMLTQIKWLQILAGILESNSILVLILFFRPDTLNRDRTGFSEALESFRFLVGAVKSYGELAKMSLAELEHLAKESLRQRAAIALGADITVRGQRQNEFDLVYDLVGSLGLVRYSRNWFFEHKPDEPRPKPTLAEDSTIGLELAPDP